MQEILKYIQSVEGVIGCAVFSEEGKVLTSAFPALIDQQTLAMAALQSVDLYSGLQIADTFEFIDLRYAEGRLLMKRIPGATLFLLCAKNINLHILATNLNLAAAKIEAALPTMIQSQKTAPANPSPAVEVSDPNVLTLRISHLANREASASFDSLGMIAVSQPTSSYISDFYKLPFKKIMLTVTANGKSGTFPVMVMKDMEPSFDGTIIVGPGIEKKLSINEGEKVEVRIAQ